LIEQRDLPLLENVLLPRTKGFCAALEGLGSSDSSNPFSKLAAVYDFTIVYTRPPSDMISSSGKWFVPYSVKGGEVYVYVKRIPVADIPRDTKQQEAWLYQLYKDKDNLISNWRTTKSYPGNKWKITKPQLTFAQILTNFFLWTVEAIVPLGCIVFGVWWLFRKYIL